MYLFILLIVIKQGHFYKVYRYSIIVYNIILVLVDLIVKFRIWIFKVTY